MRVLYVDDERSNLVVFVAAFGGDFDIVTAESAVEALEILERDREIALLVTDQRMPGMTGTQLAEAAHRRFPDVIRYLVSAYSDLTAAIDAINHGQVQRYLRKPWDAVEVRIHLREGLELYALRQQVRALERRMREVERVYALGVVAGSVVHELRNPMSTVTGYLELARTHPLEPAVARAIDGAWDAVVRMGEISRAVELSTRPTLGRRRADLGKVADLTLQLVIAELRHRATPMIDVAPGIEVPVSETQLGQVVLNLLVNAIEAFPPGAAAADARIRVTVERRGERAVLEVADNGPGVPDALKTKIFDPFFTTKLEGGTGLGLAISRHIVEDVAGTLTVTDEPGGGARFVVDLPLA